jgi:hypothetical protein
MTKYINLETKENKTVFTKYLCSDYGWRPSMLTPEYFSKIVYLGNCSADGDMFACYNQDTIHIYRGIKGDEF